MGSSAPSRPPSWLTRRRRPPPRRSAPAAGGTPEDETSEAEAGQSEAGGAGASGGDAGGASDGSAGGDDAHAGRGDERHKTQDARETEQQLLDAAGRESVSRLREHARRTKAAADPDPEETARRVFRNRRLRRWNDDGGGYSLFLRATLADGARIDAALQPLIDQYLQQARRDGRHEPAEAHGADALMTLIGLGSHNHPHHPGGSAGNGGAPGAPATAARERLARRARRQPRARTRPSRPTLQAVGHRVGCAGGPPARGSPR
ncbi:MAG: hypothetical protein ACR2MA_11075 [Egibacteraceae bacterium]